MLRPVLSLLAMPLLLLLTYGPRAQEAELDEFYRSAQSSFTTRADRIAFAAAGRKYWRAVSSTIPRNSPETLAWLESEQNSGDTERYLRATRTREYALRELAHIAEACEAAFGELESPSNDLVHEMRDWATKPDPCFDTSYLLDVTERASLDPEPILGLMFLVRVHVRSVFDGIVSEHDEQLIEGVLNR